MLVFVFNKATVKSSCSIKITKWLMLIDHEPIKSLEMEHRPIEMSLGEREIERELFLTVIDIYQLV